MRVLLFSLTLFFFSTLSFAQNSPGRTPGFSALTFNLHCFDENWEKRLDLLAKEVALLSPTVLAFQEVCTSETASMIEALREKLIKAGYPLQETAAQFTHRAWDKYDEYVIMMSKEPVEGIEQGFLPASPLMRGYVAFKIRGRYFVNTHLEHLDPKYRKEEIEFLTSLFSTGPHVIMGDLNSNPKNVEQNSFKELGYTPFFAGATYPSQKPLSTYDGFWVSKDFEFSSTSTVKTVFTQTYDGLFLSDHVGVLLRLNR